MVTAPAETQTGQRHPGQSCCGGWRCHRGTGDSDHGNWLRDIETIKIFTELSCSAVDCNIADKLCPLWGAGHSKLSGAKKELFLNTSHPNH